MRFLGPKSFLVLACALLLSACNLGSSDQQWRLASSYIEQKQYLRAVEEYTRIVNFEQKGDLATKAQQQITLIYERYLSDYPRAIRSEREVYRRTDDPHAKRAARLKIADIYSNKLGDFSAAADEYERVFEEFGNMFAGSPERMLEWADALMETGKFADAALRYNQFRSSYPGNIHGARVLFLEAQAYLADQKYDVAIESFRELIRSYRSIEGQEGFVAESYYGLGMAFEAKDDLSKALEAYRESLAKYPNPRVVKVKIERLQKRKKERRL